MLERAGRKRNSPTLLVGMKIGAATMENSMKGPQPTKNRVVIESSNPIPAQVFGQNHNSKRYMHPNVHSHAIHNSQDMETTCGDCSYPGVSPLVKGELGISSALLCQCGLYPVSCE